MKKLITLMVALTLSANVYADSVDTYIGEIEQIGLRKAYEKTLRLYTDFNKSVCLQTLSKTDCATMERVLMDLLEFKAQITLIENGHPVKNAKF